MANFLSPFEKWGRPRPLYFHRVLLDCGIIRNYLCCKTFSHRKFRKSYETKYNLFFRDCFVTGKWKGSEDAEELLKLDDDDDNEEVFGDFEDLETGESHKEGDSAKKESEDTPR